MKTAESLAPGTLVRAPRVLGRMSSITRTGRVICQTGPFVLVAFKAGRQHGRMAFRREELEVCAERHPGDRRLASGRGGPGGRDTQIGGRIGRAQGQENRGA